MTEVEASSSKGSNHYAAQADSVSRTAMSTSGSDMAFNVSLLQSRIKTVVEASVAAVLSKTSTNFDLLEAHRAFHELLGSEFQKAANLYASVESQLQAGHCRITPAAIRLMGGSRRDKAAEWLVLMDDLKR